MNLSIPPSSDRHRVQGTGLTGNRDIIDTTEANGNVWKMLFGPVNDDFDDDP